MKFNRFNGIFVRLLYGDEPEMCKSMKTNIYPRKMR